MTINKNQAKILNKVGLYILSPVFSHGEFYVALSKVNTTARLKTLKVGTKHNDNSILQNIV